MSRLIAAFLSATTAVTLALTGAVAPAAADTPVRAAGTVAGGRQVNDAPWG